MRGRLFRRSHTRREALPWYERDGGSRLAHDKELLCRTYPHLRFDVAPETGRMVIQGDLVFQLACNVPTQVRARLVLPHDYPRREPHAYDADGRFPHEADRHFHPDGRCCLWLSAESGWNPSDPDALLRFIDQVSLFFDRQFVYEAQPPNRRNRWPGGERSHGVVGYLEYVRDSLGGDEGIMAALAPTLTGHKRIGRNCLCPCGSNRKFKICHLRQVEATRRRLSPDEMAELSAFMRNGPQTHA